MSSYSTIQQHEPLRVPAGWSSQEKQLIVQLEALFDDLYSRFNRLKLKDLGSALRETITSTEAGVSENAQKILETAQDIIVAYTTAIENKEASILQTVSETYSAKTETESLEGSVQTRLDQTSRDITAMVTEVNAIRDSFGETVQESLSAWVRFSSAGIELGKSGSDFTVLLSNDRLSFRQSGSEIAYVSNNRLYITEAQVTQRLSVGGVVLQDIGNALVLKKGDS